MNKPFIYTIFLLSGISGLIYQITWMRMLVLFLGVTSHATGTVLAIFMGGLCLGAWLLGKLGDRVRSPVSLYGWLELGIGLFGLLSPFLFSLLSDCYVALISGGEQSLFTTMTVRVVLVSAALLIPTTLMGATLPLLVRSICRSTDQVGEETGLLYGLNTFGAVIGTLGAAFYLIEAIGLKGTVFVAAAINVVVACMALANAKAFQVPSQKVPSPKKRAQTHVLRMVVIAFALSGMLALAYEVLWTRYLIYILGTNSVYAFSTILAAFLFGIMLGSLLASKFVDRLSSPISVFAWLQMGIGVSVLLSVGAVAFFTAIPSTTLPFGISDEIAKLIKAMLVLFIPTTLSGFCFSVVTKICARDVRYLAEDVGRLYAANTFGAIFGALLGAFVILPLLGLRVGMISLATANLLLGIYILRFDPPRWIGKGAAFMILLLVGASYVPAYQSLGVVESSLLSEGERLLFYKDGAESSVAIVEREGSGDRFIVVDGDDQAITTVSGQIHLRFLGQLPALFHDNPKDALVIAFGTGITAGSLLRHKLDSLDIVELSSTVIEASPYFAKWNYDVLSDPRVRVLQDDGRNHLLTSAKSYDIITVDPIDADDAGITSLYSQEFYELVKANLRPGGVTAQWIAPQFHPQDYKMLLRTFVSVFPTASVWFSDFTAVVVGYRDEPRVSWDDFQGTFLESSVRESLWQIGVTRPQGLLEYMIAGPEELKHFIGEGPLNTDDYPLIEYRGPRHRDKSYWKNDVLQEFLKARPLQYRDWFHNWEGVRVSGNSLSQRVMRDILGWYIADRFPWEGARVSPEQLSAIYQGWSSPLMDLLFMYMDVPRPDGDIDFDPDSRYFKLLWRGVKLWRMGQFERARKLFAEAGKENPLSVKSAIYEAVMLDALGKTAQARKLLSARDHELPDLRKFHWLLQSFGSSV